jgi:ZIP family zinc transporter
VLTALVVGLVASCALVIGALAGAFFKPPARLIAVALAFASGALIISLAFELFGEAFRIGGPRFAGGGLLAGAAAFVGADRLLERNTSDSSGLGLLAGVTLDGVPENTALGVALIGSSTSSILALLVSILASNLPEALGGAAGMRGANRSRGFVFATWTATGALLAAAVAVGYAAFSGVPGETLAVVRAFAGGAVLASLADTLMPQAYDEGGAYVAFATAAGFLLAFLLSQA